MWPQSRVGSLYSVTQGSHSLGHMGILEEASAHRAVSLVVCHDRLVSRTLLWWLEATFQFSWVLEHGLLPGEDSMGTPVAVSSAGR